jgi:hypothetical protein
VKAIKALIADIFSLSLLIVTLIVGLMLGVIEFGAFIGIPLVVFVWIYVFWITPNYFFEIVESKALGNGGWPVFSLETLVAGRNQIGVVFSVIVLGAAGSLAALRYTGRDELAEILLGAGLAVYPASVALLAVTRSLAAALNPLRIVKAVAGMGAGYLYCLLASVAVLVLFRYAQTRGGLWYFPLIYGLFLQAYLIGSIVYGRRHALGVDARRSPEAKAQRLRDRTVAIRNGISSHAYGFAGHGNLNGALNYVEAYIANEEDTLEVRLWMWQESLRWENGNFALAYGRRLIDYCEQNGFSDEAAAVRAKCELLNEQTRRGTVA